MKHPFSRFTIKFIFEIVIFAAIVGGLSGGILFFDRQVEDLSIEIKNTRRDLARKAQAVGHLAELRAIYKKKVKSYEDVLHNIVPRKDELINLSRDMEAVAQVEGLNFGFSFLGEEPANGDELGFVRFGATVSGNDLAAVLRFIRRVENFRYLTRSDDLELTGDSDGSSYALALKGKVFYR